MKYSYTLPFKNLFSVTISADTEFFPIVFYLKHVKF